MKSIGKHIISFLENWHLNRTRNHILFWVFNSTVFFTFEFLYGNDLWEASISKAFTLPILILNSYYLAYVLAPYLFNKAYFKFALGFISGSYIFSVMYRFAVVYGIERFTHPESIIDPISDILTNMGAIFGQYFLLIYITPIFFILLKSAKDSFVVKRKYIKLQQEKKITELNFLRSQVHPHFLFNTLNNIYVLALKKDKRTSNVVKKLGDMMEYMVDSSSSHLVPIHKEITLINNYLDLEKLRYGERLDLTFESSIDDKSAKIAPLMLMSFIENAFKHGVSGDLNQPKVDIKLFVKEDQLTFKIFNTKSKETQKDEKEYKRGIGVSNVKRQLDLIYGSNYTLDISEKEVSYQVDLTLRNIPNHTNPKNILA